MNPPIPGLRPLWLNARSPAKVSMSVAPGETLMVSDDVADQLQAADPHFHEGVAPAGFGEDEAETVEVAPATKVVEDASRDLRSRPTTKAKHARS